MAQRARRLREPLRLGLLERARADRADRRRRRRARLRLQLLRDAAGLRAVQVGEEEERLERLGAAEGRRRLHDDERRARAALCTKRAASSVSARGVDDDDGDGSLAWTIAHTRDRPLKTRPSSSSHRTAGCGVEVDDAASPATSRSRDSSVGGRLEAAEVFAEVANLVGVDECRDEEGSSPRRIWRWKEKSRRRPPLERRREVPARNLVGRDEAGGLVDGGDGGGWHGSGH